MSDEILTDEQIAAMFAAAEHCPDCGHNVRVLTRILTKAKRHVAQAHQVQLPLQEPKS